MVLGAARKKREAHSLARPYQYNNILHFHGSFRLTNSSHEVFHLGFSFLQMIIVLPPSRIRHNRDKGVDVQQGPAQRFLFRLRPCINLLIVSCCFFPSGTFIQPGGTLAASAFLSHQTIAHTWKLRAYCQGRYLAQYTL